MSVQIFKLTNGKFIIGDRLFSTDRALSERAPVKLKNVVVINSSSEFIEKMTNLPNSSSEFTEEMTNLPLSAYLPFAEDGVVQLFERQVESFADVNKSLKKRYDRFVKFYEITKRTL